MISWLRGAPPVPRRLPLISLRGPAWGVSLRETPGFQGSADFVDFKASKTRRFRRREKGSGAAAGGGAGEANEIYVAANAVTRHVCAVRAARAVTAPRWKMMKGYKYLESWI